jgi:hypothetical protein
VECNVSYFYNGGGVLVDCYLYKNWNIQVTHVYYLRFTLSSKSCLEALFFMLQCGVTYLSVLKNIIMAQAPSSNLEDFLLIAGCDATQ